MSPLVRPCRRRWCPDYAVADGLCRRHWVPPWDGQPPMPPGWEQIRAGALRRAGGRCQNCGAPATDVHHVRPRTAGGGDDPGNLRALCGPCHDAITARR